MNHHTMPTYRLPSLASIKSICTHPVYDKLNHPIYDVTKHRGQVANTPASYSGDPGFISHPRRPAIQIEVFVVFLSPSRRMPG
jgi:hypothetical protein